MPQFQDSVELKGVTETPEGYIVADAFTVRTGIQRYAGHEVNRPDLVFVDVYRSEAEVFSHDALHSFAHKPITIHHPREAVTRDNWAELAVGEASTEVLRDGHRMKLQLIVKADKGIRAIRDGMRELSAGYTCDLDFVDGKTEDGEAYQAVQKNIRANHVAIVPRGRAGADFRIGDADSWGAAPITTDKESPTMTLRNYTVDGITIQTTDQGAEALGKLESKLRDSAANVVKLQADHAEAITAKDTRIGELTAQLADAQNKVPDGATLDKLVADRATLIADAKSVSKDIVTDGKTDAEIRRAAVVAKYGEPLAKDASDDVITGMFRAACADKTNDPVRRAMQNDASAHQDNRQLTQDHGQGAYESRTRDAWKGAGAAA